MPKSKTTSKLSDKISQFVKKVLAITPKASKKKGTNPQKKKNGASTKKIASPKMANKPLAKKNKKKTQRARVTEK